MTKLRALIVLAGILVAMVSLGQTVMIVNTDHPATAASAADISNIYLGKTTMLNGAKVVPVDQKKDTEAGKHFLSAIVKMDESTYKNLWVEKLLSGEATPPVMKSSDAEVVSFVQSTPGGIGFVSASADVSGVKVVAVDGKKEW